MDNKCNSSKPPALPPKPGTSDSSAPPKVPPRSSSSVSRYTTSPIQQSNESTNYTTLPLVQAEKVPSQPDVPSSTSQTQISSANMYNNTSQHMLMTELSTPLYINPSYGANSDCKVARQTNPIDREYDTLNITQPFNKLLEVNAIDLPLQVDICESMYGMMGGESLFEEEKLDVYFLKCTEVVTISKKSVVGTSSFQLPLCSAYQCNVFTCKDGRFVATKETECMETLLTTSTLPLVVYVTVGCKKTLSCSSVQAGELLIIKSVQLSKKNKIKSMQCWSISTRKHKYVDGACKAQFSTNSEQTKVYIHDIIGHYKLPMYATFYFYPNSIEKVIIEERSVVKSAITRKAAVESSSEVFEIFLTTNMMSKKREVSNNYNSELIKQARVLYDSFNPMSVHKVIPNASAGYDPFQTKLFKHVLANWKDKIKLYFPKRHSLPSFSKRRIQSSPAIIVEEPPTLLTTRTKSYPMIASTITESPVDDGEYEDMTVNDQVTDSREPQTTSPKPSDNRVPPSKHTQPLHNNQESLIKFSIKQVLDLLDALHLSQYKDEFEKEEIDGLLFTELTPKMLEELNIKSELHKLKIMHVVKGVKSVAELMSKD